MCQTRLAETLLLFAGLKGEAESTKKGNSLTERLGREKREDRAEGKVLKGAERRPEGKKLRERC